MQSNTFEEIKKINTLPIHPDIDNYTWELTISK
jgi:hypothetical protein